MFVNYYLLFCLGILLLNKVNRRLTRCCASWHTVILSFVFTKNYMVFANTSCSRLSFGTPLRKWTLCLISVSRTISKLGIFISYTISFSLVERLCTFYVPGFVILFNSFGRCFIMSEATYHAIQHVNIFYENSEVRPTFKHLAWTNRQFLIKIFFQ